MTAARGARDAEIMLAHALRQRGELLLGQAAPGALAALAVGLLLAAASVLLPLRPQRRQALSGVAPTLAILAGLLVMLGDTALRPRAPVDRLPELVLGMFACGLAGERLRTSALAFALLIAAAIVGAWWLVGAPFVVPPRNGLIALAAAALSIAALCALARHLPGPLPLLAAGFSLWAALHLAGGVARGAAFALVMTAGCAGMLAAPRTRLRSMWPVAGGIAGVAVAVVLSAGALPHRSFNRVDWAACAPLLALAILAGLRRRGWGDRGASALAATAAILLVWIGGGMSR